LNTLYNSNCPGYAQAYFAQQCSLDGLYDRTCPNYAEAYAKKNILAPSTPKAVAEPVVAQNPASVAIVSDAAVNQVITTTATSASPAAAATTTVPLAPAPAPATAAVATTETKKETAPVTTTAASSDSKDKPKTARQELAERRQAAARAAAVERGKNMAAEVGKAADMEAQIAVQNVVIQAMGFTPGFDAYGKVVLPDAQFYRPFEIYKGQSNIDNPSGRRFMTGSDRLHSEMVDSQYK
jgi:hypothetical protein